MSKFAKITNVVNVAKPKHRIANFAKIGNFLELLTKKIENSRFDFVTICIIIIKIKNVILRIKLIYKKISLIKNSKNFSIVQKNSKNLISKKTNI